MGTRPFFLPRSLPKKGPGYEARACTSQILVGTFSWLSIPTTTTNSGRYTGDCRSLQNWPSPPGFKGDFKTLILVILTKNFDADLITYLKTGLDYLANILTLFPSSSCRCFVQNIWEWPPLTGCILNHRTGDYFNKPIRLLNDRWFISLIHPPQVNLILTGINHR